MYLFFDFVTFTKSDGYKEACKRASFALQKGVFHLPKGHLLQCKRCPFGRWKMVF